MKMEKITLAIITILLIIGCNDQASRKSNDDDNTVNAVYDSTLAKELGADIYGMKQYVIAFLLRGDKSSADSTEAAQLQRAHLDNITRMAGEGELLLAGPFLDNTDLRGIYIFNVNTVEEAQELTGSDPAIKAGVLKMELHPWYGSAALQLLNDIHATIQSEGI